MITPMRETLDQMMEAASRRLVEMDYLACERLCLEALVEARRRGDWIYYARILMPLQESRRQRRMIAADASVQLGTAEDSELPRASLALPGAGFELPGAGCVLLGPSVDAATAQRLEDDAAAAGLHVELLRCVSPLDGPRWTLATSRPPTVRVEVAAPPAALPRLKPIPTGSNPLAAHWFIAASEALGDAAYATVDAPPGSIDRIEQLERCVAAVGDHEILHQRLGDAARAMRDPAAA